MFRSPCAFYRARVLHTTTTSTTTTVRVAVHTPPATRRYAAADTGRCVYVYVACVACFRVYYATYAARRLRELATFIVAVHRFYFVRTVVCVFDSDDDDRATSERHPPDITTHKCLFAHTNSARILNAKTLRNIYLCAVSVQLLTRYP